MGSSRMPKPPEASGTMRTAGRTGRVVLGIAAVAAAGLAALLLWSRTADESADGSRRSLAEAMSEIRRSVRGGRTAAKTETPADPPPPGSMQANLIETTDADRNHLFWRAIADAGYQCSEVRAASAIGSTGSAWRANCGENNLYLVEVEEFGRLSVVPMPISDSITPPVRRVMPDNQGPIQQFREPE
jgi:hypothetical protein